MTRRGPRHFYVDDHIQPVREELFNLLEVDDVEGTLAERIGGTGALLRREARVGMGR